MIDIHNIEHILDVNEARTLGLFIKKTFGISHVIRVSVEFSDKHDNWVANITSREPRTEPHAKWIDVYEEGETVAGRCSHCGWEAYLYETDVVGMPYCPNCGAKMEELVE